MIHINKNQKLTYNCPNHIELIVKEIRYEYAKNTSIVQDSAVVYSYCVEQRGGCRGISHDPMNKGGFKEPNNKSATEVRKRRDR